MSAIKMSLLPGSKISSYAFNKGKLMTGSLLCSGVIPQNTS